ncbi:MULTISPECIES: peptidylprolyl isomerase [unclassified Sulfitobacter]|uniref:peptidylprolyl isomerase n=1 Tax=unclassified Sulfitobacter TaxID=196795 RepID=UPI0007C2C795|nr:MULTISPECIES: peptidylprolyl isomerase [unclassified Sulfitobacter]KZX98210.1 peptidylprolyl isomerase [Sulfitobacter sp. HI0023]KZY25226.1 peptidylprolyl isomerase [Sulfitobacter sp. HI0040]KZZ62713.1 peptidylprolyl isomerase [Sulfitobacter sp. HI0129]
MHKPFKLLATAAVATVLALPLAAQDDAGPKADTVVATVNGTDITVGHMIVARAALPPQYQELPDDVLFTGILDQLIQQAALADTFEGDLPARVTLSLENEKRSLTAGEVIEKMMADPLPEADVQAAYDEQFGSAEPEQEFNASHILVETEEEAREIMETVKGGADFVETAKEKSTGPSGPGGGSLGWFGKGAMVPAFEAAVVELEPGEVSEPVQTQFGWHVIKLNETRTAEAPALEDVRTDIENQLRQETLQAEIERLAEAADVDRKDVESIDPAVLKQTELLE